MHAAQDSNGVDSIPYIRSSNIVVKFIVATYEVPKGFFAYDRPAIYKYPQSRQYAAIITLRLLLRFLKIKGVMLAIRS